jgi:hypothetical protein
MSNRTSLGARAGAALAAVAALAAGCDDASCPSAIVVVLASPDDGAALAEAQDVAPGVPGLQVDVAVRSNLAAGSPLTLTVRQAATGLEVRHAAVAGDGGGARFAAITLPGGVVTLAVEGASSCGADADQATIEVDAGGCAVSILEGPMDNEHYAPRSVLNAAVDGDPELAGFQATVAVAALAGFEVTAFVRAGEDGEDVAIGQGTAGAGGELTFATTLAEGDQLVRASCVAPGGSPTLDSAPLAVVVDTEAPSCALADPPAGAPILATADLDGDSSNGYQLAMQGVVGGDDVEGQPTAFTAAFEVAGSPVTGGQAIATGEVFAPGEALFAFEVTDWAGNVCRAAHVAEVLMGGCAIAHVAPTELVVADADPATDGLQADVVVEVDPACAGRTVETSCGVLPVSAVVPADGVATLRVTLDQATAAEGSRACSTTIVSAAAEVTSAAATLAWDTRPPVCGELGFVDPAIQCGGSLTAAQDADDVASNGVQIDVRFAASGATEQFVELTRGGTTTRHAVGDGGVVRLRIRNGTSRLEGVARDAAGHECRDPVPACALTLTGGP